MLSTRMIIDHLTLSMNSRRWVCDAPLSALAVAPIAMSAMCASAGSLEPRNVGKCQLAAVHMHAAELGATVQGRKHLSGIEQALGVEGAFQALLLVEVNLAEHLRHQVALLDADAVLAGEHAAELDAGAQDVGAEGFGAFDLAGFVGVVE